MKRKNVTTIATVAFATAVLTVAAFLTNPLNAGNDAKPPGPTNPNPKLVADNIEMTLACAQGHDFKAGDQPVFDLRAVNTLDKPAQTTVRLTLYSSTLASMLSRTPRVPTSNWKCDQTLTLAPHETKTITITATDKLIERSAVSVVLAPVDSAREHAQPTNPPAFFDIRGPNGVVALTFFTPSTDKLGAATSPTP